MQIVKLLESGADDESLAAAMAPIVNSRFLKGHADVPLEVVRNARSVFNSPVEALIPGKYDKGMPTCLLHLLVGLDRLP